jgi:DNA mismatch endonuclease (patch repair protein)
LTDCFTKKDRSRLMSRVKGSRNKSTELALISLMRRSGIVGWRRNARLFGRPDFVFWRQKLAIFVDGCFWHRCPIHGAIPATNTAFWATKLARNSVRDTQVNLELRRRGWRVMRVWQHELRKKEQGKLLRRLRRRLSVLDRDDL